VLVAMLVAVLTVAAGCGSAQTNRSPGTGQAAGTVAVVRVFAAASLAEAFADLETGFEQSHPGYDVELNLAGSSSLGVQILAGAPADVFASANTSVLDEVLDQLAGESVSTAAGEPVDEPAGEPVDDPVGGTGDARSTVFATNRMVIAVPTGNPAGLTGIEDFARPELFLGLCAVEVPCGALAEQAMVQAMVDPSVDTREPDVRALLTRIAEGELDGGIVYQTDLAAESGRVETIDGQFVDGVARYPIAALDIGANPTGGQLFVDYVLGASGQSVLGRHRFGAP
jgi:molybdate transport system substrate-binding protein